MSFCTAVNCMDGRAQDPVAAFLREHYGVRWVDAVTEAGAVRHLVEGTDRVAGILERCRISFAAHDSVGLAVAGHADCAGHPVDDERHQADLLSAARVLADRFPGVPVVALWVDAAGEVHPVSG